MVRIDYIQKIHNHAQYKYVGDCVRTATSIKIKSLP